MLLLRGATTIAKAVASLGVFQYMLLLRGATGFLRRGDQLLRVFQYMLLLRGATPLSSVVFTFVPVSIHAPLARSNSFRVPARRKSFVSIHAPLARSNKNFFRQNPVYSVSIHAPLARSNRGNINRSGSKCKSKNRAKYQLSFVKEHYCILRFLIIV